MADGYTTDDASADAAASSPNPQAYFRALLSELRHLQERYGQALLALGEARGEAATLRHRLALLETRAQVPVTPIEGVDASATDAPNPDDMEDLDAEEPAAFDAGADGETIELPGARAAAEALAELQQDVPSSEPAYAITEPAPSRVAVPVGPVRNGIADIGAIGEREEVDLRAAVGLRDPPPDTPLERLRRWLAG
ncbi:MAG: hypothetical protein ABR509_04845 [Candidatus Limnocylindria bacterium]